MWKLPNTVPLTGIISSQKVAIAGFPNLGGSKTKYHDKGMSAWNQI